MARRRSSDHRGGDHRVEPVAPVIRLTITPVAYAAIAATLPSSAGVEQQRAPNGDYHIWLEPRYVDRLRAMRVPGESYCDVILRLAKGERD